MENNFTHVLTIQIGLDFTKILSPENVPGVMAYLGIDNEAELLQGISSDKYNKAMRALKDAGFEVIGGNFEQVNNGPQPEMPTETSDQEEINPEVAEQMYKSQLRGNLVKLLTNQGNDLGESLEGITLNEKYAEIIPNKDDLFGVKNIDSLELEFSEMEDDEVAVLSYLEDGELKYKKLHNSDFEQSERMEESSQNAK
ncbi:hypothetical protein [Limosilactobacillus ingluviei]|uniref:Uncharacterized protein n=1 Tax=Limosilactobacillus ingluviei DSM 15946 TaxID=1423760 RepID=A0A0R1UDZ8_9LACO|nr:hypothetical protein [Limosilactobacillus ingluviei]KRL91649.1 hypothetical protein FC43_GL001067 [Limosilactobacillus ingluviei DSM 15946]